MERSTTPRNTISGRRCGRGRSRGGSVTHEPATSRKHRRWWLSSALLLLALPALAGVVKIERMSPPPLDLDVSVPAGTLPAMSGDGRFIAVVLEDESIYVRDRQSGKTERVERGYSPVISSDGRFIAFQSDVDGLVPGDANGAEDLFVRDWQSGKTELVSVTPNGAVSTGYSRSPAISGDGRFIAFASSATDLLPADVAPGSGGSMQVFVRDRQTGRTELVSVSPTGEAADSSADRPAISGDGRFVAFVSSADNLAPGTTNHQWHLFVRDRQTRKTELISALPTGPFATPPGAALSADGRVLAFVSNATNLVPGHTGGLFARDRQTGATEWVAEGWAPSLSADGRFLGFISGSDNLAPGNTNGLINVFVRDRQTGKAEIVSVGANGAPANGESGPHDSSLSISADGRFVAFWSDASNLVPRDQNRASDLFVRDRLAAISELITATVNVGRTRLASTQPAISADGQWVVFITAGQLFERNRRTGVAALGSATASGKPANGTSYSPAMSADGRFIAYQSTADDLTPGDTNDTDDIFVRDRQTGKTERVSVAADGAPANGPNYSPSISADGRVVAFVSNAGNLVPGHASGVFVRDRETGKTEWVAEGGPLSISADGRFLVFWSGTFNVFVRDRQTGTTELVSVGIGGKPADERSSTASISADGRFVAFASLASNLVPGDTNGQWDCFVRDRLVGTTELVSITAVGAPANEGSFSPAISADGRFIAFLSRASNLVPGDANRLDDIFLRDRQTRKTELVTVGLGDQPANGWSLPPSISADGRFIAFSSAADNLVPGDTNRSPEVFVAERE
jgi:Tol biopolymer transport system component